MVAAMALACLGMESPRAREFVSPSSTGGLQSSETNDFEAPIDLSDDTSLASNHEDQREPARADKKRIRKKEKRRVQRQRRSGKLPRSPSSLRR